MRLVCLAVIVLFVMVAILPIQAQLLDEGLIVYFDFDQADGKTITNGAGANHGNMNNQVKLAGEGKYGGALDCTDQNSSVTVESFPALEQYQDHSYLFWIKFTAGNNGSWSQIIAKKAPRSDRSPGIWIPPNSLNLHWRFSPRNRGTDRCGPTGENSQFDLNKWYHVAGVKQGTNFFCYVDGQEVAKKTGIPAEITQGREKLYIGKTRYRSATFLVDELAIYDRAV
ncbi:MAG TPA: LamG domain-containing protein, partial [Rhodospirillales bacterium]|nr:LamG domain-containing protein [Rhodospirillales bacterium]